MNEKEIEKRIKQETKHIHCLNCRKAKQNRLRRKYKGKTNVSISPDASQDSPESTII